MEYFGASGYCYIVKRRLGFKNNIVFAGTKKYDVKHFLNPAWNDQAEKHLIDLENGDLFVYRVIGNKVTDISKEFGGIGEEGLEAIARESFKTWCEERGQFP